MDSLAEEKKSGEVSSAIGDMKAKQMEEMDQCAGKAHQSHLTKKISLHFLEI